jgi:hypothetical protein
MRRAPSSAEPQPCSARKTDYFGVPLSEAPDGLTPKAGMPVEGIERDVIDQN